MFKAEYVFVRILAPLIIGIGVFYFFQTEEMVLIVSIIFGFTLLSILVLNITYKKLNIYKFKGVIGILMCVFFFILGGLLCLLNNEKLKFDYFCKEEYQKLKIWVNN